MRKTLTVVAMATALTGGTATLAAADEPTTAPTAVVAQAEENGGDNNWIGLLGLLGLAGLGGLIKRKDNDADGR